MSIFQQDIDHFQLPSIEWAMKL